MHVSFYKNACFGIAALGFSGTVVNMIDSKMSVDRKRLIAARKRMGLTQADMAKKAKISLRTVSEYENQETRLQQLAMHKLTNSISADPYDLWGEIPERATVFASVTKDITKVATWFADGWFNSLDVIGMPRDVEHRDPLIKILKISEEADKPFQSGRLSDLMLRRFECLDCLSLLSRESVESKAVDNELKLPKVQFAIEHVPQLKCVLDRDINSDTGEEEKFIWYKWSTIVNAYIDFEGTDFDKQGKSYNYVSGYKYHLPAFYDIGFEVDELSIEEQLAEEVKALNARPEIEFKEEEINLSAEDIAAGTPENGQPGVDKDPKEPDKKLKEDES